MTDHTSLEQQSIITQLDSYLVSRDFNNYPEDHLQLLFNIPEYQGFQQPITSYFNHLRKFTIPETVINTVAQAIASYLSIMYKLGTPELAQFLLPPTIDPYIEIDPNNIYGLTLIASWEVLNGERTKSWVEQMYSQVIALRNSHSGIASCEFIQGSMFTEKTLRVLMLIEWLEKSHWGGKVFPGVAAGMEEPFIKTRVGSRPNSILTRETRMSAPLLDLAGAINLLNNPEMGFGDICIIDEATFIPWTQEDCRAFCSAAEAATLRGVFVLLPGLNTDFRGINLPLTQWLEENRFPTARTARCNANYAYRGPDGEINTGSGETYTFRYDVSAGLGDLLLPVPISRVHAKMVKYVAVPGTAHPFLALKEHDFEAYNQLLAVGGRQELFDAYRSIGGGTEI